MAVWKKALATATLGMLLAVSAGASAQTDLPSRNSTGPTDLPSRNAPQAKAPVTPQPFSSREVIDNGHKFFGDVSRGLATAIEDAFRKYGEPNGYILGQEGSGSFFGGLRYGEGKLFTRNAGIRNVYWQGPTLGFDWGADGSRVMMLVYRMPNVDAVYTRFGGADGSAYLIGGFSVSAMIADDMILVPIASGVGARLGVNVGYLKLTPQATWNPF